MIKLVIVDDEPFILRSIKSEIEQLRAGFEVVGTAYDGEEALAIIEMTSPDVVFSDIRMPIMDGLQLIEHLKTQKSNIITVILSGFQEFEYARKALQLGARDYLLKPIKTAELSNTLNTIYKEISGKRNVFKSSYCVIFYLSILIISTSIRNTSRNSGIFAVCLFAPVRIPEAVYTKMNDSPHLATVLRQ